MEKKLCKPATFKDVLNNPEFKNIFAATALLFKYFAYKKVS